MLHSRAGVLVVMGVFVSVSFLCGCFVGVWRNLKLVACQRAGLVTCSRQGLPFRDEALQKKCPASNKPVCNNGLVQSIRNKGRRATQV